MVNGCPILNRTSVVLLVVQQHHLSVGKLVVGFLEVLLEKVKKVAPVVS